MPDPAVVVAMREHKQRLLAMEAAEMRAMARRWLDVERSLEAQITALTLELAERTREGKATSASAIYRLERYKRLREQAEEEFQKYAAWADEVVVREQEVWAAQALQDAGEAIEASYWPQIGAYFDRLPREAVEVMAGLAGNGQPVGVLLQQRLSFDPRRAKSAAEVWARLVESLVQGTAQGWNPRKTADKMKGDLAGGLNKALQIARSEQIRVYREASRRQYEASGVVMGQKRLATHDDRVCAACLADEGTVYSVKEIIPDHSQGRCTGVPVVKGMPPVTWTSGEDWFREQTVEVQRQILGKERLRMWQEGGFGFDRLVTRTYDPVWGDGVRPTALKELVG